MRKIFVPPLRYQLTAQPVLRILGFVAVPELEMEEVFSAYCIHHANGLAGGNFVANLHGDGLELGI